MDYSLEILQKNVNYFFKDVDLLKLCLTHPSNNLATSNGKKQHKHTKSSTKKATKAPAETYERAEFLGDAILGFVIAEHLYKKYPHEKEGHLAKRKAALVNRATLADIARKIMLDKAIIMGKGEEIVGGRENDANLENALEALIAAIFLDSSSIDKVQQTIIPFFYDKIENMKTPPKDARSALQEWTLANNLPMPKYEVIKKTGPAHSPSFTIMVTIENIGQESSVAGSKKQAMFEAAKKLLKRL